MPILTLGLQNLRRQVNEAFPDRDKTTDGTGGDGAHAVRTSGHNPDDTKGSLPTWDGDADKTAEWRAWDMDSDLRDDDVSTTEFVEHIRRLSGLGKVLRFVIYNRKIYHADNGFEPETYAGDDPHTNHVHFEGARTQAADNNTTFDFRLDELVGATPAQVKAEAKAAIREVLGETRPYTLARIKERGWGDQSLVSLLNYMFEALVAAGVADVDGDGDNDALSVQARLGRLEAALDRIEKALVPDPPGPVE